jgi:hypothetical protein
MLWSRWHPMEPMASDDLKMIFCSHRLSHAVLQMAGGSALSRRLSEVAAMDEVKAAKMQAEYEAQQDAALQKKKRDRQEQQQLLLRTRQQQVLHAVQGLCLSVHACVAVELVCQLADHITAS